MTDEPTTTTEGVSHCACVDPATPVGRLLIDTGKLLPGAPWMDAHLCDYGAQWGMAARYPDGRRKAIRFKDPASLTPSACAELLQ